MRLQQIGAETGQRQQGRLEHQEDNSAVESLPRVLDGLGSLQGSIETSLGSTSLESTVSTPLVPAVIPTPRRTSTPTVSRVLELLYRTPVETANDSGSQVQGPKLTFLYRCQVATENFFQSPNEKIWSPKSGL